jgi:predicted YcjX-like family ATPase
MAEALVAPFSETVIRIGVTGLARSGKTVFITSLVANLLDRGRMGQFSPASRIEAAYLLPQPDDTVPRFDYETHLAAITGPKPHWPDSTRAVSELRISLKVRPAGLLAGISGARTVHIDIVDYPGEWLLDLGLLDKSFEAWSAETLKRMAKRNEASAFLATLRETDPAQTHSEQQAQALARDYTAYLHAARAVGFSDCTPGRFLMPGELEGSPVLTFSPLPLSAHPRGSLARELARRFEAYKAQVVRPFFRDHFSKVERQVVLVDVLGAIHAGPEAVDDLRRAMADTLSAFRPGANAWLSRLMGARRVERILFAATKADHLHHLQHNRLTAIMEALVRQARDRADFAGAKTGALAIASLRATVEQTIPHAGRDLDCVRGTLLENGKQAAFYPGELPEDPNAVLGPARDGGREWTDTDWKVMRFAPAALTLKPGEGPPHIRLDRAAEFLLGDRL